MADTVGVEPRVAGVLSSALWAWIGGLLGLPMVDAAVGGATAGRVPHLAATSAPPDPSVVVAELFAREGRSLVRLARLFVDDRNAAEDLVQEAFIRLSRSLHRIEHPDRAPAYLRSIVLNLARDENRRGLLSMRHRLPLGPADASPDDDLVLRDEQRAVLDVLRRLPARQRTCLVLRYYDEASPDDIASDLGISRNSVKTHLQRGLVNLQHELERAAKEESS